MTTVDQHIETNQAQSQNRFMQALLIAAIAASGLSMIFSIGTAVVSAADQPIASVASDE